MQSFFLIQEKEYIKVYPSGQIATVSPYPYVFPSGRPPFVPSVTGIFARISSRPDQILLRAARSRSCTLCTEIVRQGIYPNQIQINE